MSYTQCVTAIGRVVPLPGVSPQSDALFSYMLKRQGEVVTRSDLLRALWGLPDHVITRAPDIAISRLRRALGDDYAIVTVRGQGYRLEVKTHAG